MLGTSFKLLLDQMKVWETKSLIYKHSSVRLGKVKDTPSIPHKAGSKGGFLKDTDKSYPFPQGGSKE